MYVAEGEGRRAMAAMARIAGYANVASPGGSVHKSPRNQTPWRSMSRETAFRIHTTTQAFMRAGGILQGRLCSRTLSHSDFAFVVLPDYLWAICGCPEYLTRVVHRVGRAFAASDARPPPWTTLHYQPRRPWHSESHPEKVTGLQRPSCPRVHRSSRARQATRTNEEPTNSPDEAKEGSAPLHGVRDC